MRRPDNRVVLMSVVLVGIGSFAGAFLDRLSFPHVARIFNTCASSQQFLVEFRVRKGSSWNAWRPEKGPWMMAVYGASIEVDGKPIGIVNDKDPLRYYLCEGNHHARLLDAPADGEAVGMGDFGFAVSRPSLMYLRQGCERDRTCFADYDLSAYEPDDLKVRLYQHDDER